MLTRWPALYLLLVSVIKYPYLIRTLSFWSALLGILFSFGKSREARIASLVLLGVVGYGGLGVSYQRLAHMFAVPTEPVPILKNIIRKDNFSTEKEELLSAVWHLAFGAVGFELLNKEVK